MPVCVYFMKPKKQASKELLAGKLGTRKPANKLTARVSQVDY